MRHSIIQQLQLIQPEQLGIIFQMLLKLPALLQLQVIVPGLIAIIRLPEVIIPGQITMQQVQEIPTVITSISPQTVIIAGRVQIHIAGAITILTGITPIIRMPIRAEVTTTTHSVYIPTMEAAVKEAITAEQTEAVMAGALAVITAVDVQPAAASRMPVAAEEEDILAAAVVAVVTPVAVAADTDNPIK